MKRGVLGILYLALYLVQSAPNAFSGPPSMQNTAPAAVSAKALDADAAAVADTRTYLERLEKLGFAGVVLVAKGDAPLFAEGFGLADRERGLRWTPATVSTVGSITKQFTGAAILKLEEDGKLGVSDPISKYFDGVPADKSAITLHHLLSHSSGLTDPEDLGDWDPIPLADFVRQVLAKPLLFAPGRGYEYSNANFSLLGAIVEKLSGLGYEAFLRERLLAPNGIYETGYVLPQWGDGRMAQGYRGGALWGTVLGRPMIADGPAWPLRANGGIHSTVYDMLRWARALLAGRVLSAESMKKYWAPHVSEGGDSFYGYGWVIAKAPDGTKIVTHNGGNGIFFADMAIVPDAGLVVFLMTNVIAEIRVANALLEQVGMRFLGGQPYPAIPEVVELDDAALKALPGIYRLPGKAGAYAVTLAGTDLFIEAEGHEAFDLLNSVRAAAPGKIATLNELAARMIAGNMKGDFSVIHKAYGGEVKIERLKANWAESMKGIEADRGRILRHEILGTASTQDRDETVVRFICEKGHVDMTYVWDIEKEGRLLGRSDRGLTVRMRLFASGEREFFTWDGGIRPPKTVRIEPGADGRSRLTLAGSTTPAVK
ncbi:MAG: class A beta-lactamase-related serine hydrolase [Candidatus Aminicenantes bacterium]|nr:MAG: class A beta-lactamase-related serine hydrolase [Candidatus Aminicenantes bacterium]